MTATRYAVVTEGKAVPPPFAKKRPRDDEELEQEAASGDILPEEPAVEPTPEDLAGEEADEALDPEIAEAEAIQDEADVMDPNAPPADAQVEWAGDLVEDGMEVVTDPAAAFSSFTGQGGETAWLDKATDGTLTGWVQAADGTTYKYVDADAWAVDVDDAGMNRGDVEDDEVVEDEPLDDGALEDEEADDDFAFGATATKQLVAARTLDRDLL